MLNAFEIYKSRYRVMLWPQVRVLMEHTLRLM